MGNCITSKTILAEENQKTEQPREAKKVDKASAGRSANVQSMKNAKNRTKKTVRFRLGEEDANNARGESERTISDANNAGGDSKGTKSGVVRIRLVLTQNELNQILNGQLEHSSAEQLLNMIKSRSKRVSPDGSTDADRNENWMPALESIPEDQ